MSSHALFTYGTLQLPVIQQKLFGRCMEGVDDVLTGYACDKIPLHDAAVIDEIGADHYLIIHPETQAAPLPGKVFYLNDNELAIADAYEGELYQRVSVSLQSGLKAWVYRQSLNPLYEKITASSSATAPAA